MLPLYVSLATSPASVKILKKGANKYQGSLAPGPLNLPIINSGAVPDIPDNLKASEYHLSVCVSKSVCISPYLAISLND